MTRRLSKPVMLAVIATLAGALVFALGVAALVVWRGLYDVGATTQHTQPVYSVLEVAMQRAVRVRAAHIETPSLASPELLVRGAACYRELCVQCHGAPGVAPGAVGISMQPTPGPLLDAARRWHQREIYWITRHGIRMSGMPAWGLRLTEDDIWAVVAFVSRLPGLSAADYQRDMASTRGATCPLLDDGGRRAPAMSLPPDELARLALRQYACVTCHTIPGLTGSSPQVGPPLAGLARRSLIAGRLLNNRANLARWIREPQTVKPGSAMPDLGVTEEHARVMADYLGSLH
jgi:mono/diheme cytochrome c family protein